MDEYDSRRRWVTSAEAPWEALPARLWVMPTICDYELVLIASVLTIDPICSGCGAWAI